MRKLRVVIICFALFFLTRAWKSHIRKQTNKWTKKTVKSSVKWFRGYGGYGHSAISLFASLRQEIVAIMLCYRKTDDKNGSTLNGALFYPLPIYLVGARFSQFSSLELFHLYYTIKPDDILKLALFGCRKRCMVFGCVVLVRLFLQCFSSLSRRMCLFLLSISLARARTHTLSWSVWMAWRCMVRNMQM